MSERSHRGYLGLGSNQGDRLKNLRAARDLLARPGGGVRVLAASSVYETEPQAGAVGQDDYLNACLAIETELEPDELLAACKDVERRLGRGPAGARHAARPIDVDVLLLDELEHRSERLELPHPELSTRRFVLEPLLELDPELSLPSGPALADARERVCDQRVTRLAEPLDGRAKPPGRE